MAWDWYEEWVSITVSFLKVLYMSALSWHFSDRHFLLLEN